MGKQIDIVMLVDDDNATNFYNRIMVEDASITDNIIVHNRALEALENLKNELSNENIQSVILFLDLNMPLLNGWQFLDNVDTSCTATQKNKLKIVVVSASEYPKDIERIKSHHLIDVHMPKPLESERIKLFAENFNPLT